MNRWKPYAAGTADSERVPKPPGLRGCDGWAGADYDVGAGRYRLCLGMTNKALQPIALWRCASSSILITVSSTAAQPRFQSGG